MHYHGRGSRRTRGKLPGAWAPRPGRDIEAAAGGDHNVFVLQEVEGRHLHSSGHRGLEKSIGGHRRYWCLVEGKEFVLELREGHLDEGIHRTCTIPCEGT